MIGPIRVALAAALVVLSGFAVSAADKAYRNDELADAAIKLEAEIKRETGPVTRPLATLRRETESLLARRDVAGALKLLSQIVTAEPQESGNWLRYSRTVLLTQVREESERPSLIERAATAAYIAYQRAKNANEEAESLALLSRTFADRQIWRPALDTLRLALDARPTNELRARYEQMRNDHGFRLLDYTVDSDAASPRACFQFSEELPRRGADFSPFVAVAGMDKPALTVEEKQLCVEGLKHGERYAITLRAGLPSTVRENLLRAAEMSIYVRDRKPFVRFTSRAYVLPRTGQRGIPVVSVNTSKVNIRVLRFSDRNLLNTVLGRDFQRNLERYEVERLAQERAVKVWQGELAVESSLNADVTTAFPVEDAIRDLTPGVYVIVAEPAGPKSEEYESIATQWFIVSDLGLASFSAPDGVHVFVQSLASAEPKPGVEVRLLSRSNEVLATRTTDAAGAVHFEAGLARGEGASSPALIVATEQQGGDYAFLNLKGPAFDLSDRGVAGRPASPGLDAFVYSERGVYRSGETVHLTALLRDAKGLAATGIPLTLVMERPDGVEYRRVVVQDQGLGGRSLSVPLVSSAPSGTYRVRAYVDPKGAPAGQTSFMVEDYIPDRMEFELSASRPRISRTEPAEVTVSGRYLYGAPASGLNLEGEVVVKPAKERPGLPGYQFGLADEEVSTERQALENLPETDTQGRARFPVKLDKVPASTRPLEAQLTIRMAEPGGRAVERSLSLPVVPAGPMFGIKPLFSGASLGDGDTASFEVGLFAPDGTMLERKGVRYELLQVETRYQWYRRDNRWEFEPVKSTRRVGDGQVDLSAERPARIALPVSIGRYRLEVATDDPAGPVTSFGFDAGYYAEASADSPDTLEVALDKPEYRAGDTMTVAVTARTAGKVSLSVVSDRLLTTTTADVQPGTTRLPLRVGQDWGTGAYVIATLRRPLDAQAQRMPGRAIGVQWFAIDRSARTLALDMPLPAMVRPNTTFRIPLKLGGLRAGDEARVVVAAVDVGILNLTNYKPPAPEDHYLGQRRLSAEIRDLYGQLIDGMQGTRGQIRSGGDAGATLSGSPPAQAPLALYSGLVSVAPDGSAEVSFDLPAFAGTVRVMAVAWSADKVGHATRDVTVRDPVVVTATLPRFLLTGDQGAVRLEIDNVEGQAGEYRLDVSADGPLAVTSSGSQSLRLEAKQRSGLTLPLSARGVGVGNVWVRVTGPAGFELERTYVLAAKPATQVLTRRTVKPLAPGESLTLSNDVFADLVPGTGSVSLSVGPSSALDVAALLQALDRYPFGCSEQIASRAMPLLYANELATAQHLALDSGADQRIREAIERLLARQGSNGSFGLWSSGGNDPWLDAYITDFLSRARERGFAVPDVGFKLALDHLRNFVGTAADPAKDGARDLAYALYVLARNGVAPIGDLRYLADAKLNDVATPIAKAQIAAALAMLGDRTRAERVYAAALQSIATQPQPNVGRADYGSPLRDAAALLTLAAEGNGPRPVITAAVQRIEVARAAVNYTSTQEQAWLILAARALGKETRASLEISGEAHQGPYYRRFRADDLASPVRVTNNGDTGVQAVIAVSGAPITPEPPAERGFKIERLYRTLDGAPADPSRAKQNQRFVVVLRMTDAKPEFARVIVADYLPAGFEIDNPRLVSSGDTGALSWIEDAAEPVHTEFRDDRFAAAFDRKDGDQAVFTVAYVVRAVSPGRYVLPQAVVEDMYRPDRFGRTGTGTVTVEAAR